MNEEHSFSLLETYNIRVIISYMCDTQHPVNPQIPNDTRKLLSIQDAFLRIFSDVKYSDFKKALLIWSKQSERFPFPKDIFDLLRNMGGDDE